MSFVFDVKGSSGNYQVVISKTGRNLIATCTCSAAKNGMACKHRLEILKGSGTAVISSNEDEVKKIPEFIIDTLDGQLFLEYISKESEFEQLKIELSNLKKQLGKLLPI